MYEVWHPTENAFAQWSKHPYLAPPLYLSTPFCKIKFFFIINSKKVKQQAE